VKRGCEDEADGATPRVASEPSPKRMKSDWEGPSNEEAMSKPRMSRLMSKRWHLLKPSSKFINENQESDRDYINNVLSRTRDVQVLDTMIRCPLNLPISRHNHTHPRCEV